MDDYISREAALNVIANYDVVKYGANKYLWDLIYEIPPADVAPVKHGHWEERIVESEDDPCGLFRRRFYCSSCGDWQTYGKTDYCPMCGASMESERDGRSDIETCRNRSVR